MIFSFEDVETGEVVELTYQIGKAPGIGAEIEHEGRKLVRIPDAPQVPAVIGVTKRFTRHFVSESAPMWDKHAPRHDMDPNSPTYGQPMFSGPKEVREHLAKCNDDESYHDGSRHGQKSKIIYEGRL
jgi:hypothetical protein